jgi:hypothetical protein
MPAKGFLMKPCAYFLAVILFVTAGFSQSDSSGPVARPFSGKMILSETPDIGGKWRGGIRITDVLCLEGYVNIGGLFTFDALISGIPDIKDTANRQTISDRFLLFTLKSRPVTASLFNNRYAVAGGVKYHDELFKIRSTDEQDSFVYKSVWLVPFVTQSYTLGTRNRFNLFSSIALESRKLTTGNTLFTSFCFVPGYCFDISKRWSVGLEYYLFNADKLPMNILWIALSPSHGLFENINRDWFSLIFWGVSYSGKHLRIDFHLANHYSFTGPVMPFLGFGWNF